MPISKPKNPKLWSLSPKKNWSYLPITIMLYFCPGLKYKKKSIKYKQWILFLTSNNSNQPTFTHISFGVTTISILNATYRFLWITCHLISQSHKLTWPISSWACNIPISTEPIKIILDNMIKHIYKSLKNKIFINLLSSERRIFCIHILLGVSANNANLWMIKNMFDDWLVEIINLIIWLLIGSHLMQSFNWAQKLPSS